MATIVKALAPAANVDETEGKDLDLVIAEAGLVSKAVRRRFRVYDLEDFFGSNIPAATRDELRQKLIDASNNPDKPEPPDLLPTTLLVELTEYFIFFGK